MNILHSICIQVFSGYRLAIYADVMEALQFA